MAVCGDKRKHFALIAQDNQAVISDTVRLIRNQPEIPMPVARD